MMTFEPDDPRSCGIVELNNRRIVVSYKEKPAFKLPEKQMPLFISLIRKL